jgi:hypothetical protein
MDDGDADQLLGIVEGGEFRPLPILTGTPARLTRIAPQQAQSPESDEIDLRSYEGRALLVEGIDQGGWIYRAEILEVARPILTRVVQEVFAGSQRS